MEEQRENTLGELLEEVLTLREEKDRFRNIGLLLAAIEFMSVCADRIISEETAEKFDPLFDMMHNLNSCVETIGYEELLETEMDFSWEKYREWVMNTLSEDVYMKKHTKIYKQLEQYLNTILVPYFFLENYMELYMTPACYFPQTGRLYYIHRERDVEEYSDWDEEDWLDNSEDEYYIQTLRVLDLQKASGKLYESCEGEILYYGPLVFYYVKRNHTLCMTFWGVDWCVYYSLATGKVEYITYHRHILGVTPQGEEILLRDSVDGSKLEVCYIDSNGEEQFVTNYRAEYGLRDGCFYTKKPYERAFVNRTYKIRMNGRKTGCTLREWKEMIWIWMLDGVEAEYRGYYWGGCGLIRGIVRGLETLRPPYRFSCEEIRERLLQLRGETKKNKRRTGRILACLSLLERMGIKKNDDLFEFWEQTALLWRNERGRFNIASKEFVKFLEKEAKGKNFVRKVYLAPDLLYRGHKGIKVRRIVEYIQCNSLAEYFDEYDLQSTFIGEFGLVNGGLYCDKAYLHDGDLKNGKAYMSGNSEKNLPGKVYYDFAGIRHIILWPKDIDMKRLRDVLERFGIEERWKVIFAE